MRILVAGTGFIGDKIVEALQEEHDVKTLDRNNADYQFDITKEFEIDEDFDVVFHTIGLAPGMNTPEAYRNVHVEGTKNIINGIKTDKIVYISALKAGEVNHSFFNTKEEAENIIRNSELNYTIIRPSTVYGKGNKLMDMIRKSAPLRIFPDISTLTQPIHIDNLTEILKKSAQEFQNQTLEVAGPEKMTVGEMAGKIYREEGYRCVLIPMPNTLQETGIRLVPFSGPFSSENINLLKHQNTVEKNDAKEILKDLRQI